MKYNQVDWSKWDDRPSEDTYNDWCIVRKAKMTQTAINRTAPHINKLYQAGISADEAMCIAVENEWRGIKYQWVLKAMQRDMQAFSDLPLSAQKRETRQITLEEELTDTSWAN